MTRSAGFLAVDLGAESGRCLLGCFDGSRLTVREMYRFANGPVRVGDRLYWDALRLYTEIKVGLSKVLRQGDAELVSLGLDAWGNDFALLDRHGGVLGNPHHHRDSQTEGMLEIAFERVPPEEIYAQTGVQFLRLGMLYQLLALTVRRSPLLDAADSWLMIPDLFNTWLTGSMASEYTVASTGQCLNMATGKWATPLLDRLGIPSRLAPPLIWPGTRLGRLLPSVAEEVGADHLSVVAPACHDTGCAVVAAPARDDNFAYLSSGTWSLLGVELSRPLINADSLRFNFTNEGGAAGTIRFLKSLNGMWLIQECQRAWATAGNALPYAEISRLAADAPPFVAVIDTDASDFMAPGDMPAHLLDYCRRTGQKAPEGIDSMARTVFEGLAFKYRWVLERLEQTLGRRPAVLHVVGGGSQNRLLNQFTADATGRPVIAGPAEAASIGNILMQLVALGHISSLSDARRLSARSFKTETYLPRATDAWDSAYPRFLERFGSIILT